jgi:hypothetical protein
MIETIELSDALPAAYLRTLNFSVRPKHTELNRISFVISGENLNQALETFYLNPKVRILDFCSAYRELRGMLFTFKKINDAGK